MLYPQFRFWWPVLVPLTLILLLTAKGDFLAYLIAQLSMLQGSMLKAFLAELLRIVGVVFMLLAIGWSILITVFYRKEGVAWSVRFFVVALVCIFASRFLS